MRILGIDPGFGTLGWAVIEDGLKLLGCGAIVSGPGESLSDRLVKIHRELDDIILHHAPAVLAMERLYFAKNATTAMDVGKCIGVVLLSAGMRGLPCAEYTPLQVKRAVTGHGKATKRQVQIMVGESVRHEKTAVTRRRGGRAGRRHLSLPGLIRGRCGLYGTLHRGEVMIARIKGMIEELRPTEAIVDVGGVGYRCSIPLSTYERLVGHREVSLFVYTYHREDQLRLFGFFSQRERDLFAVLIGITGIGPAMALSILSGITTEDLVRAVRSGDLAPLMRVPGIGRSKAEKLVFELGRRLKNIEVVSNEAGVKQSARNEAIEALAALGFDEGRAARAVDELLRADPSLPIEPLVKAALKSVSS
ncbi:MAG: Holliday junction branch migration protein RuvA [Spirochaetota bacterium]